LEILGAIRSLEYLSVSVRPALAKRGQGTYILLCRGQIPRLQILSQLRQVRFPLLMVVVQLLVDGAASEWLDILAVA
jgi:hypothetical protein